MDGPEWFELKNNTSVYVTGLPDDATIEEIAEEFSKCGVVKTLDDGTPKIKLYKCAHLSSLCSCIFENAARLCSFQRVREMSLALLSLIDSTYHA